MELNQLLDEFSSFYVLGMVLVSGFVLWLFRQDSGPERYGVLTVSGRIIAGSSIIKVRTTAARHIGLLNHTSLAPGSGLWLQKVTSVHTVGMLFPIDVLFLDKQGRVLQCQAHVLPGIKSLRGTRTSTAVLEMSAGSIADLEIKHGDELTISTSTN